MSKVQSYLDKGTLRRLHLFMEMEGIKTEHAAIARLVKKGLDVEQRRESDLEQIKLPIIAKKKEEVTLA